MTDQQIINTLGGAAAVARLLGLPPSNGTQRVHNWLRRGIPSRVKLEHQKTFAKALKGCKQEANP